MIPYSPPLPYHLHSPQVDTHTIEERCASNNGKGPRRDERDVVAKVEESDCDGAKEDGKFEPGQKGAFGSEVDFWLNANGDVDACGVSVISLGIVGKY